MSRIVCFGEMLIRLSSLHKERLFQSSGLQSNFVGAEANVGVTLARLGNEVEMVTCLPDNVVGRACIEQLHRQRVGTRHIALSDGRMGLYYLEIGAMMRPSAITYDRENSAFACASADVYDWPTVLDGADALHICGITLAVSESSYQAAQQAVEAARAVGVKVVFDCNYRAALWKGREARATEQILAIISQADVLFGGARDAELLLGHSIQTGTAEAQFRSAAAALNGRFPNLQTICSTHRETHSVDSNSLTGYIASGDEFAASRTFRLDNIVDRIGGGDAFAGGTLHKLLSNRPVQETINFGVASAAMKHSIPGDFNLTSEVEVNTLAEGGQLDVSR